MRWFGFSASVLLHLCIVGAAFVWGQDWGRTHDFLAEPNIPVALISAAELADITNIPAASPEPAAEEPAQPEIPDDPVLVAPEPVVIIEPEIAEAPPPPPELEPETPEVAEEPTPEPPEQAPAEEIKPDPPKPAPPQEQPRQEGINLDQLWKDAENARNNAADSAPPRESPGATADQARSGSDDGPITATVRAKVIAAMKQCWREPDGAPNPEQLVVEITLKLNRDGTLQGAPKIENDLQISLSGNRFWAIARDEAIRAAYKCQPFTFLLEVPYAEWTMLPLTLIPGQP